MADCAIEFQTLSADSGWNPSALFDSFLYGQSSIVKDDVPDDLNALIALTIDHDKQLMAWGRSI